MTERGIAAALCLAPLAIAAVLLALGLQDFDRCFYDGALSFASALAVAGRAVAHPLGWIGLLPYAALALIWATRSNRRLTFLLWLGLLGLMLVALWPPGAQHDCDRKGPDGDLMVLLLVVPGLVAVWLALWKSRPVGRSE